MAVSSDMREHTLVVESPRRSATMAEMAVAHLFATEMPRIATRLTALGGGTQRANSKRTPRWVEEACLFRHHRASKGRIVFYAPTLRRAAPRVFTGQRDLFVDTIDPGLTAFSLLGFGLRDMVREAEDSDRFDEPMLTRFRQIFGRIRREGARGLIMENLQDLTPELTLGPESELHAKHLLDKTPAPRRVRVTGRIVSLRLRGQVFEVQVGVDAGKGDVVRCVALEGVGKLATYFEHQHLVALDGEAVYRPSGRLLRIDADRVDSASAGDAMFARVPVARPTTIERLHEIERSGSARNWLAAVTGKWPGDETEDELLDALKANGEE